VTIGVNLQLPPQAVTQKFAVLGTSGSGKTYGAGKFVEELDALGAQVIIVDTVGNWWGLRLAANGMAPGIRIPVIGGDRGDLPLAPDHGEVIANASLTTMGYPVKSASGRIRIGEELVG
jgi:DNA helicase HerA-like ATPase